MLFVPKEIVWGAAVLMRCYHYNTSSALRKNNVAAYRLNGIHSPGQEIGGRIYTRTRTSGFLGNVKEDYCCGDGE